MPKFENQGSILVSGPGARRNLRSPSPVGPGGAVSAGPTTIVEDTFTAADTTTLSGRTPSPTTAGNNWVVSAHGGESFTITGNKAFSVGGVGGASVAVDAGVANCTVSTIARLESAGNILNGGLVFRAVNLDAVTYLAAFIHRVNADLWLELQKITATVGSSLGTYSFTVAYATNYLIEAVLVGNDISIKLDGTERLTHTLSGGDIATFGTSTKHGLYSYEASTPSFGFDNFKVTVP